MVNRSREITIRRRPEPKIRWLGPLPIWARPGPAGLRLADSDQAGRPAILRFDHDGFMQEFITTAQSEPERLGEWTARPETWRKPMASPRTGQPESSQTSQVAFLYERTHRLAAARKPLLPKAVNLQGLKARFTKRPLTATRAFSDEQLPLKLFQPAQKRHYLVTASLVREEPGLPDFEPQPTRQEKISFVVRRLLPAKDSPGAPMDQWDEFAFVPGSKKSSWRRLGSHGSDSARSLASGEEQLPMFPVSFEHKPCKKNRKLFSGTIPVGRREQWMGAELGPDDAGSPTGAYGAEPGPSMASLVFQTDVAAPWKLLLEQAEFKRNAADSSFPNFGSDDAAESRDRRRLIRTARDELQTGSWYVLLDFALFLQNHLPDVWGGLIGVKALESLDSGEQELVRTLITTVLSGELAWELVAGKPTPESPAGPELRLLQLLQYISSREGQGRGSVSQSWISPLDSPEWGFEIPSADARYTLTALKWTLADALVSAAAAEQGLEAVETSLIRFDQDGAPLQVDSSWPDFLFPLADPDREAPAPAVDVSDLNDVGDLERKQHTVDVLADMVEALLPPGEPAEELMGSLPLGSEPEGWFVVRCVCQRPACGPLFPSLLSGPTQKFQLAPFFDPDAPARPVRIPMPMDISPAGLRRYQKNTGFVISDMLCGKIKGIRKMTFADLVLSVLPWPFHKDLPDPGSGTCKQKGESFGMICSLSIPIVTLCALILMMIMVALFDVFFRWIPYLFICLPLKVLKGKKGGGG